MSLNTILENTEIIHTYKHGYLDLVRKLFYNNYISIYNITSANNSLLYISTLALLTSTFLRTNFGPVAYYKRWKF